MLNKEIHRQKMYNILIDIFSSNLWKYLAFKWWTACYFFHKLDRFSTDLDFDLILNYEKNIKGELIWKIKRRSPGVQGELSWKNKKGYPGIDDEIINILKKYWDVKKSNYNIKLSYSAHDMNIKIDINRNIWKNNKYEIINFYWTDIKTQDKSTIFANKLVALIERFANRDIYDVYFFIKNNFDINEEVILERTGKTKKELFIEIVKKLKNISKNTIWWYKILDWLWEVLKDEKHKSFVKNKLVIELIWLLEFKLNYSG